MYKALMLDLQNREKEFVAANKMNLDACRIHGAIKALEDLNARLAALQTENAELRTDLSRVAAERDAARHDCAVAEENHRKVVEERDKLLDRAHEAQVERDCARAERDAAVELIGKLERCLLFISTAPEYREAGLVVRHTVDCAEAALAEWRGAQGEG